MYDETFVEFETAKLLKDAGLNFPEPPKIRLVNNTIKLIENKKK